MPNERITEEYVRAHFKGDALFSAIKLDEQKASVAKVKQCLAKASKSLTGKIGSPEFIISFPALPDEIIVVECKSSTKFHVSSDGENPAAYAVDGALHYSAFLSKEYNVIAIAVSGETLDKLKISSFYQKKGQKEVSEEDPALLDIYSYIKRFQGEEQAQNIESAEITRTAIELNKELNDYSIVEYERCTLVSAILLALQDPPFKSSYKERATSIKLQPMPARLTKAIINSIKNVLDDAEIDDDRASSMLGEYEKIKNHAIAKSPLIKKKKASEQKPNYVLRDLTETLEKTVLPLITLGDKGYDVLGRFYREFIRYAGTDKKTGLVLTPQHITELFCDVVNLNVNDVVYDSCCGSGGFLISAMKRMFHLAGANQKKKETIKDKQLIGIERRADMFTFACSNMMMSGDGKSHIYHSDSFSPDTVKLVRGLKPTVAFLNPPYDVGEDGQLEFIENALSCLQAGGRCVAIVQMSCAISDSPKAIEVRERLLLKHTLSGVFSMPHDLFHPIGVVTCIMVFEAKKPHPQGFKSFFGYFKDDGFQKTKDVGRINKGNWETIRSRWLELYLNREKDAGLSALHSVSAKDEWCAEAYIETDYAVLTSTQFEKSVREFASFQVKIGRFKEKSSVSEDVAPAHLNFKKWREYYIKDIFDEIVPTKGTTTDELEEGVDVPYIAAKKDTNGFVHMCALQGNEDFVSKGNCIVFIQLGQGSAGYTTYQEDSFIGMYGKTACGYSSKINKYSGLFLVTVLDLERPKFSFGRSWTGNRLKNTKIRLPAKDDGEPDWAFMENYIQSLQYGKSI